MDLEEMARMVSDYRAKVRRGSMRLAEPDAEKERSRRFWERVAYALVRGADLRVDSVVHPGSVALIDDAYGGRPYIVFNCTGDRDRFCRALREG